jgi:hypothetical protein
MNAFDVRIYMIRRRKDRRRPYEVRWQAAGRARSKSFITKALADSYRAELVRAARQGLQFDPATGEPVRWAVPAPPVTTWLQHAVAYADLKWPHLAPHSRASLADALATVTPALTRPVDGRPPARTLRVALYRHAFNPTRRAAATDPAVARALGWLARASLPVTQLNDRKVIRAALDALTVRLDGSRAAAATVTRKRAVFHDALGYAVELRLLPANPVSRVRWPARTATTVVNPRTVASPAEVRAILAEVALSLWLNATGAPADVAARAGNSTRVLQDVYAQCVNGRDEVISRQIDDALDPDSSTRHPSRCVTASGLTHRRHQPDPVRYMSVNDRAGPCVAHDRPASHARPGPRRYSL